MNNPHKITKNLLKRPSGYGVKGNEIGNLAQDVSYLWRELPVPVIAVLQGMLFGMQKLKFNVQLIGCPFLKSGMCFGAGLQIALGADMRYATPNCKLSIMESKWGLIPDMGASIALRELIRIDVAKELTMTGRIMTGEEAAALGLVTATYEDPLKHAEDVANDLVKKSPDAIACAKELYQRTWMASEKQCLEVETELQNKLLPSWNQMAASGRAFGWEVPYFKRKD